MRRACRSVTRSARSRAARPWSQSAMHASSPSTDSLLDAALAARLPELALSTHYRSRHEDLFAFANKKLYGDRLEVLPAAHASSDSASRGAASRAAGCRRCEPRRGRRVIDEAPQRRRTQPHARSRSSRCRAPTPTSSSRCSPRSSPARSSARPIASRARSATSCSCHSATCRHAFAHAGPTWSGRGFAADARDRARLNVATTSAREQVDPDRSRSTTRRARSAS